ncbi:MAG: M23 family metallopeptidase, partial [Candidatus Pacebacteria bacterium]|nr:M23 family metallopeptidase [Candidatus Paceibacterota bacterium]
MKASLVTLVTLVIWGNFSYSEVNISDIPVASSFYPPVGDRNANVGDNLRWGDCNGYSTWLFPGWYSFTNFNTQKDYQEEWYSENPPYSYHPGEDWNGNGGGNSDLGQPVFSVSSGKVIFVGTGFGNTIVVVHKLSSGELVASLYAHLDSISVNQNQEVTRSSQIGTVGNSGTTVAHLHFEIRRESMLIKDSSGNISLRYPANHWPGTDTAFISSNYYPPSDFILSHQSSETSLVGMFQDGWHSGPSDAILSCYNSLSGNKGSPIDNNGGGIYVHDWLGVTIQDFGNSSYGDDGMYAIVFN